MITVRREKNLMFGFNQISKIRVAGCHIHVGLAGFLATLCCFYCQCRLYVFKIPRGDIAFRGVIGSYSCLKF